MTHPLPAVSQFVCGQPVTRVDGQLKVTGKAPYAADNQIPGLVYATLVCSTVARGRVNHMDTSAALRHHDVLRVLTDFATVKLPFDTRQVSYFGQPLAVVIATTLEAAAHGASRRCSLLEPTNVDGYRCTAGRYATRAFHSRLHPR